MGFHGQTMGKPWENHGKFPWILDDSRETSGLLGYARFLLEQNMGKRMEMIRTCTSKWGMNNKSMGEPWLFDHPNHP